MIEVVSDEDIATLVEWCEPRPNAVQGVKQPRDSWKKLTAALRELQHYRASTDEAIRRGMRELKRQGEV
jgi:hypothetical protein